MVARIGRTRPCYAAKLSPDITLNVWSILAVPGEIAAQEGILKYWLTTHWPHLRTKRQDAPHDGVWVADDKRDVIAPMKVGDLVWIYESQSGRDIVQEKADGERQLLKRHRGRGGVVTLCEISATPEEDPDSQIEKYANGTSIWWRWHAETRTANSAGFVSREDLNRLLGYMSTNPLRGFGTRNSGLMEISPEIYAGILVAFRASHAQEDDDKLRHGRTSPRGGPGGEGPIHRALKNAIAQNPSLVLREEGLELVQLEYPFGATGDRIDVLLRDRLGRYVAVEVEPECPVGHIVGPLQCMKYRSLLAYQLGREVDEVRTCLVTHDLEDNVRSKSEKYGIECFEISLDH